MGNFGINTSSLLRGLVTLSLVSIAVSNANSMSLNPPTVSTNVANSQKSGSILVPMSQQQQVEPPTRPKSPDCFYFLPGTPAWNQCFREFTENMAAFQEKMHAYVKAQAQAEGETSGDTSFTRTGPGQYYTGFVNSNTMSTSNSYTGGYAIHAVNMALSTSLNNNIMKLILHTGPIDKFDTKANGQEITINVVSKGNRKWAKILVPKGINVADVKVERSPDAVYLSGPTLMSEGGNFQISQSSSDSTGSSFGSTSVNLGQLQAGQIPAVPMPEFQNMFQNMFQNFFTNMFGGRSLTPQGYPNTDRYYSAPSMWFY